MTVIDEIAAERRRQIEVENFSPEHDETYRNGELAHGAAAYARWASQPQGIRNRRTGRLPNHLIWPLGKSWWKPTDRRRDLIKAAALIVAEIERLDRADRNKMEIGS